MFSQRLRRILVNSVIVLCVIVVILLTWHYEISDPATYFTVFVKIIVIISLMVYFIPRQLIGIWYDPGDGLLLLRWGILVGLGGACIALLPGLVYQTIKLVGYLPAVTLQSISSICTNLAFILLLMLLGLSFNYRIKKG